MKTKMVTILLCFFFMITCAPYRRCAEDLRKEYVITGSLYSLDASLECLARRYLKKPGDEKTANYLKEIIPRIQDKHIKKAQGFLRKKHYDKAIMEYDRLIELNALVSRLPGDIPKFDENKIMDGRSKIVREAAKSHFNKGNEYKHIYWNIPASQRVKRKETAKKAAIEFRKCLAYDPSYPDAEYKYEFWKEKAIRKIVVMPFTPHGRTRPSIEGRIIADNILSTVQEIEAEFIKFLIPDTERLLRRWTKAFDPDYAPVILGHLDADDILYGEISIDTRDTGWQTKWESNQETLYKCRGKKSGDIWENITGCSGKRYVFLGEKAEEIGRKQITAKWRVHTRETSATIIGNYILKHLRARRACEVLTNGSFSKRFSDSSSYCDSLSGDERAVPPGVKSCLDREPTPPTLPHILAKEAAKNAGKEIAKKLFKYYH